MLGRLQSSGVLGSMFVARGRASGLEGVLRSLGAVLDASSAQRVLIREIADGLFVRSSVASDIDGRLGRAAAPVDRIYAPADFRELRQQAEARRGTGHIAGPIEQGLRVVGHVVDVRGLVGISLVQHDPSGGWLLWHRAADGRMRPLIYPDGEIIDLAIAARNGRTWAERVSSVS